MGLAARASHNHPQHPFHILAGAGFRIIRIFKRDVFKRDELLVRVALWNPAEAGFQTRVEQASKPGWSGLPAC